MNISIQHRQTTIITIISYYFGSQWL